MPNPTVAGIYCRISQDRTGEGLGVERQEADCRQLAERLGWQVAGVYTDNDVSAFSKKPRKAFLRLLDDLKNGTITASTRTREMRGRIVASR